MAIIKASNKKRVYIALYPSQIEKIDERLYVSRTPSTVAKKLTFGNLDHQIPLGDPRRSQERKRR